jgi:hypothetical protein
MDVNHSTVNKRSIKKKVSETGRIKRSSLQHRTSLIKSVGKMRKNEQETPIVAIQQVHLLRKQKAFLTQQAFVFEKKAETVREQVKVIDKKIAVKKALATKLVKGLEDEDAERALLEEDSPKASSKKQGPDKGGGRKVIRLGY